MDQPSDDFLRPFLAGRDVACPQCDYNLRDLSGDRCPECGQRVQLQIGLAEPRQRLLIAGLVGLSAGAGLSGLLLIYLLVVLIARPMPPISGWAKFFWFNVSGLAVESFALMIWLRNWKNIRTLPSSSRAWLVVGCWCLSLANVVVLALNLR